MTILRRRGGGAKTSGSALLPVLMSLSLVLGGCGATMDDVQSSLVAKTESARVVTRIVNDPCDKSPKGDSESLTTGSVKGLSKVKDGFGIPYDEYAPEYQASPVPVTDDSYEANKNRGIGYAGIEDHYVANLMAGQEHSPDHPEFEDCTAGDGPTIFPELTTEEEKYGCNMRWEYSASGGAGGIDGYFDFLRGSGPGHRQYVAIHSLVSDKWCICCPWDWGPARAQDGYPPAGTGNYGNIGGVSPQVAEELGFDGHGERSDITLTEWWWVENSDQVKCGPVNDLSQFTQGGGGSSTGTSGGTGGSSTTGGSASGSKSSVASEITTATTAKILTAATTPGTGGSSSGAVKVEPANPNSFVNKIHPDLNHGEMPKDQVKYIMMHDTESETDDAAAIIQAWINQGKGTSTHFMVDKQGKIFQCVEMDQTGWHSGSAGQGANEKFGITPTPLNPTGQGSDGDNMMSWYSYGIEIVHEHDDGPYPEAQLDALDRLVAYIDQYLGKEVDIIDHKEWANQDGQTRKQDCSDDFPLDKYKKSRNHKGVETEEDIVTECGDEGDGSPGDSSSSSDPGTGAMAIVNKAVEIAGTASPDPYIAGGEQEKPTDPRLATYVSEKERVYPGDPWWASCCRVSATAIKASGADENWPLGPPSAMYEYAASATDKWENVGTWRGGDSADVLKPGDVLITMGNHIKIFVGNEAVKKKFPNSDANMYSGSAGVHQPWCYNESTSYDSREYGIFRLKESGTSGKSSSSGTASTESTSSGKSKKSSKDDGKSDSSGNNAIDEMLKKAHSIIGAGYSWSGYEWTGDVGSSVFTCSGVPDFCLGYPPRTHCPETYWQEIEEAGHFTTDISKLNAGDLVFYPFGGRSPCGHVGIYIGNGQIIDSIPNGGVQIRDVNYMQCLGGGPILEGKASSAGTGDKKTSKPSRYMFVGDSRTCGLFEAVHAELNPDDNSITGGTSAKGSDGTDEFWIGKVGMGCAWLQDTAVPIIDSNVKSGDAILIWMGVNDYASQAYADLLNQKASGWKSKGASVYFVSVGPVDEGKAQSYGYSDKNSDIEAFNSDIKSKLPSDVQWMDIYDKIKQGFDTGDGIHYDDGTSKKIYEWMKEGSVTEGESGEEDEEEEDEEKHYNVSVYHTS